MRAAAAVTQRAAALDAWARRAAPFLPGLFVVLWSTGFIAAKYGLPYAPPLEFLLVRFTLVASLMTFVAFATRAKWPRERRQLAHIAVAAWLVHGVYLGGVFVAIAAGMPAGTSAMLVGLQPILTVFLARAWLGERISRLQWAGLALGLVGVYFVVRHKIGLGGDATALVAVVAALVGISVGTLYQKKFCAQVDLRSGAVVQFTACALLYAAIVALAGWHPIDWTPQFLFALGWSSCFGQAILVLAKKHGLDGQAAKVTCEVTLNTTDGFSLAADLKVALPGADKAALQALVEEAHTICPYSKATRGNVPVTLSIA